MNYIQEHNIHTKEPKFCKVLKLGTCMLPSLAHLQTTFALFF